MSRLPRLARQAVALQKAFDGAFAEPLRPRQSGGTDLLAVRLGGERWTIPLTSISGLHSDKKITPLPGITPGLLGLAGFRGVLVPVYDLAARIGLAPVTSPRWMVLAAARPIAFAFAELDGHLRSEAGGIVPLGAQGGPAWTAGFVELGGEKRPVLHLPAILDLIPKRKDPFREGNDS
jgi:purine-binding chemotaxis protein CheW